MTPHHTEAKINNRKRKWNLQKAWQNTREDMFCSDAAMMCVCVLRDDSRWYRKRRHPRTCDVCGVEEKDGYPKLPLHEESAWETSEKVRSGMGSIGWKEIWCIWEECGATAPPTELAKQEEEEDKEECGWGLGTELQMMEGWDTAEERGGRGRKSSWPNDWLRDCLKLGLDLGGKEDPSPCCPASRLLSTNLWEPMASCGSMWRWRRDIILGAVGTKQQHCQQPKGVKRDGQGETEEEQEEENSGKILRCWDTSLLTWTLQILNKKKGS